MKTMLYTVGVAGAMALTQAQAAPQNLFVHADKKVEAIAGCLVEAGDNAAVAACLCAKSHHGFEFCGGQLPLPPIGDATGVLAGAEDEAYTKLSGEVQTIGSFNDLLIEVAGSCTLGGGTGVLTIWDPDEKDPLVLGDAKLAAQYAAVYMWPEVNGEDVGRPVRLCARGDLSLEGSLGGLEDAVQQQDEVDELEPFLVELGLNEQDLGGTYAFQWALEDILPKGCYHHRREVEAGNVEENNQWRNKCKKPAFNQENYVKMHFLAVAAVGAGVLSDANFSAEVVWANAKLKERAMHVESQKLEVKHQDYHH